MRVPLSWLRDYIDVELEPERLAERLTLLGMEVKGIERRGTDWQNVVVGELLAVDKHPRADRLSLTRVTVGSGEPLEIVCGATNIAPGQRVPVALPGAVLPGDRRIERTEKMGVVSNGMLCSGDELGLTGDADGILILPADTPIGAPLADLYGDVVLDIDVKPNRGDALSIVGLAREIAAVTGAPVRLPVGGGRPRPARRSPTARGRGRSIADLCPRFVGRWVGDVRIGPSPELGPDAAARRRDAPGQQRRRCEQLRDARARQADPHVRRGGRPRTARIVVRRAARRASGSRRSTTSTATLDRGHPRSSPTRGRARHRRGHGRRGVARSGRTTTDVIIESAIFDPVSIRRTGQRYALRSEASLRFEKGQALDLARIGADRCARLVRRVGRWELRVGRVDSAPDEPADREVAFRPARVGRLLGLDLDADEQGGVLARAGIVYPTGGRGRRSTVAADAEPLAVEAPAGSAVVATIPSWRRDLVIEADLIEEIARIHGYEEIPATLPDTSTAVAPEPARAPRRRPRDAGRRRRHRGREPRARLAAPRRDLRLAGAGPPAAGEAAAVGRPVTVLNPLSPTTRCFARACWPAWPTSSRRTSATVAPTSPCSRSARATAASATPPREWWRLAFALTGAVEPARLEPARPSGGPRRRQGSRRAARRQAGLPVARRGRRSSTSRSSIRAGRAAVSVARSDGGSA